GRRSRPNLPQANSFNAPPTLNLKTCFFRQRALIDRYHTETTNCAAAYPSALGGTVDDRAMAGRNGPCWTLLPIEWLEPM
ncbi:MAG: hypothetical protein V4472_27980, partial [Pseudomonadota bacterium]